MAQARLKVVPESIPSREEQLGQLADEQLACRASGHWWDESMAWGARDPRSSRHQANWSTWIGDCRRCDAHRELIMTTYMDTRSRRTDYPEGYQLQGAKPEGGTKKEARQELARRTSR